MTRQTTPLLSLVRLRRKAVVEMIATWEKRREAALAKVEERHGPRLAELHEELAAINRILDAATAAERIIPPDQVAVAAAANGDDLPITAKHPHDHTLDATAMPPHRNGGLTVKRSRPEPPDLSMSEEIMRAMRGHPLDHNWTAGEVAATMGQIRVERDEEAQGVSIQIIAMRLARLADEGVLERVGKSWYKRRKNVVSPTTAPA